MDGDVLRYRFELYSDESLSRLVADMSADSPVWTLAAALPDNHWYYWRARAEDAHGLAGDWMAPSAFFTDQNGIDDPPQISFWSRCRIFPPTQLMSLSGGRTGIRTAMPGLRCTTTRIIPVPTGF